MADGQEESTAETGGHIREAGEAVGTEATGDGLQSRGGGEEGQVPGGECRWLQEAGSWMVQTARKGSWKAQAGHGKDRQW